MRLNNIIFFAALLFALYSCKNGDPDIDDYNKNSDKQLFDSTDMTNNFYDNTETYPLPFKGLIVDGEIVNPGEVDVSGLAKHSVIVKETLLDSIGNDRFVGAYRYDGYSLFDILNDRIPEKLNAGEFSSVIDLYVEIENDRGEKVVFSWGEIYYPSKLHNIIIATDVSRIVPSRSKDLWVIPAESKIVSAGDLITERNISSPVRISVRSCPRSFAQEKNLSPMYSNHLRVFINNELKADIPDKKLDLNEISYNTIFYGRGRGIHSTQPFSGILLKDLLGRYCPFKREIIKNGIICIAAKDGYRCILSCSELFNRNDQDEFLLVQTERNENGGFFRLFTSPDFFSDRAVKSVNEIHLDY
jgi:hypothetical protein